MSYAAQSTLAKLVNQYNAAIRALRHANQLKRKDIKSRVFRNLNRIRAAIKRIPLTVPAPCASLVLESLTADIRARVEIAGGAAHPALAGVDALASAILA